MADPSKAIELEGDWEATGVSIEIPKVNPAVAQNMERKRKHSAFSGSQGPPRASREEIVFGKRVSGTTPPPAALNTTANSPLINSAVISHAPQVEVLPQPAQNAHVDAEAALEDEEQRLREEMDARLREQGFMLFVADLEAMKRVYSVGLNLFRTMSDDVSAEMARVLRGKVAAYSFENPRLSGELAKVQAELNSRDDRYLNLSSENRELWERAEKMQGLKEELDGAPKTIAEQGKQLEALPGVRAEKDRAKEAEKKAREEAKTLKQRVEELAAAKAEAVRKAAAANAGGYQKALNLSFALAPPAP